MIKLDHTVGLELHANKSVANIERRGRRRRGGGGGEGEVEVEVNDTLAMQLLMAASLLRERAEGKK